MVEKLDWPLIESLDFFSTYEKQFSEENGKQGFGGIENNWRRFEDNLPERDNEKISKTFYKLRRI